jgi:hypothetical protein
VEEQALALEKLGESELSRGNRVAAFAERTIRSGPTCTPLVACDGIGLLEAFARRRCGSARPVTPRRASASVGLGQRA